jgi:hypothetical protein
LYIGNNPHSTGGYVYNDEMKEKLQGMDEVQKNARAKSLAMAYIESNPGDVLSLIPRKFFYLFSRDTDGLSWLEEGISKKIKGNIDWMIFLKWASQLYYVLCVALSLLGLMVLIINGKFRKFCVGIPIVVFVSLSVFYLIFFGAPRFHYIIVPFLLFYGDFFVGVLKGRSRGHSDGAR